MATKTPQKPKTPQKRDKGKGKATDEDLILLVTAGYDHTIRYAKIELGLYESALLTQWYQILGGFIGHLLAHYPTLRLPSKPTMHLARQAFSCGSWSSYCQAVRYQIYKP